MKCNCPMKEVYETGFAALEAHLFLDTHPCCKEALTFFREASEKYEKAKNAYAESYGPLVMTQSSGECCHDWIKGPWPWEGGNC